MSWTIHGGVLSHSVIFEYQFSLINSLLCGTLSKAVEKSRKTTSVGFDLFRDFDHSSKHDNNCISVDFPIRYAY